MFLRWWRYWIEDVACELPEKIVSLAMVCYSQRWNRVTWSSIWVRGGSGHRSNPWHRPISSWCFGLSIQQHIQYRFLILVRHWFTYSLILFINSTQPWAQYKTADRIRIMLSTPKANEGLLHEANDWIKPKIDWYRRVCLIKCIRDYLPCLVYNLPIGLEIICK